MILWWVEAAPWCGLCRYSLLDDGREVQFPPGRWEGSSTPPLWGRSSVKHGQLALLQQFLFFGSFSLPWQSFSPHQSLMLLHTASWYCEGGSTITPLCPQKKRRALASPRGGSQHESPSGLLAGPQSGQMHWRKQAQEEDKKQRYTPSMSVHPLFMLTRRWL